MDEEPQLRPAETALLRSGTGAAGKDPGLRAIPGVGRRIAQDLEALGFDSVASLRGQDPQELYDRDCIRRGYQIDRCLLYVYRCAVYFAQTEHPEPEKCKWWYWKDCPEEEKL